jgi:methyl-accepting chemotaxis protein
MQTLTAQAPLLILGAIAVLAVLVLWMIGTMRGQVDALRQDAAALQQLMRDIQDNYAHTMDAAGNFSAMANRLSKDIQAAQTEIGKLNATMSENRARMQALRKEVDSTFQSPEVREFLDVVRE